MKIKWGLSCFFVLVGILGQPSRLYAQPTNLGQNVRLAISSGSNQTDSDKAAPLPIFKKDIPVWVSDVIAFLSLLISFLNLVFIIVFFWRANQDRSRERGEDRIQLNLKITHDVGNFWIQELILKRGNELLHGFFDKYEKLICESKERCNGKEKPVGVLAEDADSLVKNFKFEFHQVDKKIIEPLEWVSSEFNKLRPILGAIEDLVTEEFGTVRLVIQGSHSNNDDSSEFKFRNLRRDFFRQLHDSHKRFVGI